MSISLALVSLQEYQHWLDPQNYHLNHRYEVLRNCHSLHTCSCKSFNKLAFSSVTLSLHFLHLTFCVAVLIRLSAFQWPFPGLCWILSIKASNCCNYLTICSFESLNLWTYTRNKNLWSPFYVNWRRSKLCLKRWTNVLSFLCDRITP